MIVHVRMVLALLILGLTGLFTPGMAQEEAPLPDMPAPIRELVSQGAQVRFLGRDYGLESWLTMKNGQEQYFYVLPDKNAFIMGLLFDAKGKLVTLDQIKRLQSSGDSLLDSISANFADAGKDQALEELKTPSERMFYEISNSNWVPLGQKIDAPAAYAFIDPKCPHCHDFIEQLRKNYLDKGLIQLRVIPVGFKDDTVAQAAYLLAAPDPQDRWYKHMDGDAQALPVKDGLSTQGVQRNLAIMQNWKFTATPMIVYRGRDGSVKIIRGKPKDIAAFVADLAPAPAAVTARPASSTPSNTPSKK